MGSAGQRQKSVHPKFRIDTHLISLIASNETNETERHRTRTMIGGIYPVGSQRCLTLKELEANVPPKVLLQCYSCLMLNKPTVRDLIREYGKIYWGDSAATPFSPKLTPSSTTTAPAAANSMHATKSISGEKIPPPKQRKKRRQVTHEMIKHNKKNGSSAESKNDTKQSRSPTKKSPHKTTNNKHTTAPAAPSSLRFSTVQILRSLAVCLKTIPAKKAALQWAEQQLITDNNGTDPHRLLRQWKQHFQKLELKATVATRRQERKKIPKQKRKDQVRTKKIEMKAYYNKGQLIEQHMLENNFDMTTRSVYEPRTSSTSSRRGVEGERRSGSDEDSDSMYPDDFDDDGDETWSFVTS